MAAIIAGGATYLVARRLQPPPAGPNMISIVAAAKDLSPGVPLTAQDLTTIAWPDNVALPGSMRKPEDVIGRPLMVPAMVCPARSLRECGPQRFAPMKSSAWPDFSFLVRMSM